MTRSSYHAKRAIAGQPATAAGPTGAVPLSMRHDREPGPPRHAADASLARAARIARVRDRMREMEVDALLLSLGADLPWLTGYEAMPLERLTMLVVPVDDQATLVVPELEAPRVAHDPRLFAMRPWAEREQPDRGRRGTGRQKDAPGRLGPVLGLAPARARRRRSRGALAQRRARSSARCGR